MTEDTEHKTEPSGSAKSRQAESRGDRLSAALRENLKRRKAQARRRKAETPSDMKDGS